MTQDLAVKALSITINHWVASSNKKCAKDFKERMGQLLHYKWSVAILDRLCDELHDHTGDHERYMETYRVACGHSRWMAENGVRMPPCPDCGSVKTKLEVDKDIEAFTVAVCPNDECNCGLVYVWQHD